MNIYLSNVLQGLENIPHENADSKSKILPPANPVVFTSPFECIHFCDVAKL